MNDKTGRKWIICSKTWDFLNNLFRFSRLLAIEFVIFKPLYHFSHRFCSIDKTRRSKACFLTCTKITTPQLRSQLSDSEVPRVAEIRKCKEFKTIFVIKWLILLNEVTIKLLFWRWKWRGDVTRLDWIVKIA